jgi:hypothetical protein
MPPECVGPVLIPPALARTLYTLASSAGAGDFVPLSICAAVLARRLSRPGAARRVQVVQGALEAVAPDSDAPVDLADSFRVALRRAARGPSAALPHGATHAGVDVGPDEALEL